MQDVPSIDIEKLERASTRKTLDDACRRWGFFYLKGNPISKQLARQMHTAMHRFFALTLARKLAVERTADNPWGFYNRELTKMVKDWKEIFDIGPDTPTDGLNGAQAQWPDEGVLCQLQGFRSTLLEFSSACEVLATQLLQAISQNLGMPTHYLNACFDPIHTSFLRLNHYPPCSSPAPADTPLAPAHGHLGINHHTDAGALTVLLQDKQAGLQVLHEDRWYLIPPRADTLLINIGDLVQVWSNDHYRAPLHRVLANATAARYSAAYFFNPSYATMIAPLPRECTAPQAAHYREFSWGTFRAARAAGDYADLGKEAQISDYRTTTSCPFSV